MPNNELYNDFLNSADVILGMSGGEGWALPEFQSVAMGKHAVILNASAYKEWANEKNSVLVNPSGKIPVYDGMFFQEGAPYNQGNIYDFNEDEFIKISKDKKNIKSVTLESLNDNQVFDSESVNLIYTLPNKSFTLVTGEKDKVYLSRINNIYFSDIDRNADNIKEYSTKSNNDIINDIYTSYDLSLNSKYKVKIFNQTIDRVKNYFR